MSARSTIHVVPLPYVEVSFLPVISSVRRVSEIYIPLLTVYDISMTSSDSPKKYDGKIATIEDFYNLKLEGWKESQGKDHFWKMSKSGYFPVRIPQKLVKKYPSEFGEKIPQSPELYKTISERDEQDRTLSGLTEGIETEEQLISPSFGVQSPAAPTTQRPEQPGTYIQPTEFILNDTARRALESVWVLEGFHKLQNKDRHELPFAHVGLDAKGNPQSVVKFGDKSEILLSLADLSVYFLIDCYMKYQKADETIISLNVEKTMLYNAYMQEKEKRKELEDAMMLKMILKI